MNRVMYGMFAIAFACSACNKTADKSTTEIAQTTPAAAITVTGCLQPASQAQTNGVIDTNYVLTQARSSTSDRNQPVGTIGSSTPQPAAATYRLDGSDDTLSSHVGHQVEIVGLVENGAIASSDSYKPTPNASANPSQPPATSPNATPSDSPAGTSGTLTPTPAPTLKVQTVRMITAPCTPQ